MKNFNFRITILFSSKHTRSKDIVENTPFSLGNKIQQQEIDKVLENIITDFLTIKDSNKKNYF